ncbi:MAG TPA: nicotinate-nucleotide adenylyltransferase [Gemmatimonadaceae bacterium]|nr:nicotinate-nucleotide adenylyltransferase [Gemmatimonadaceae bacterium]
MRLGVLGGTFDPPHVGHLLAASDAFETLALDRLLFIPAAAHPFKGDSVGATPEQRVDMLALVIAGDVRFGIDTIEIERSGLSYTVDTLADLARRYPDAERFFLIGEDLVDQVATWRAPERLPQLAEIIVLARGDVPASAAGQFRRLNTRRVDVSSTEIRARARTGLSLHGFVPDPVAAYIRDAGLYR